MDEDVDLQLKFTEFIAAPDHPICSFLGFSCWTDTTDHPGSSDLPVLWIMVNGQLTVLSALSGR